jgi:tetratricopeptide (TPR) repeat protein
MLTRFTILVPALAMGSMPALAQDVPRALVGHFELAARIRPGLTARDSAVRARCAFLLGQIGDRASSGVVRPLLRDASPAVRYQAGIALCGLGDPAGIPAAEAALASAAEWVRYYAVHGLAATATPSARQALERRRVKQGELITARIEDALKAWPWPSVAPTPAARKMGPFESLHDLFVDAAGLLVIESDGYWHHGEYPQCVRCNEAALFLDPHHVELYGTSAWLLWSSGLSERAESLLRQGLTANPKAWEMWFDAGYHYMLKKDYRMAARLLGRAVALGAPGVQSRQYCHALEKAGHPDRALEAWQNLLAKYPDDPIAPNHMRRLKKVLAGDSGDSTET